MMKDDSHYAGTIDARYRRSPYASDNVRGVIAHYLSARLLSGVAGIVFVVWLARYMEVSDYARFATIAGIAATIGMLTSIGLEKAVTCYLPQGRIAQDGRVVASFVWRILALRAGVLFAVTAVLACAWLSLTDEPTVTPSLLLLGAAWIVATNLFQFLALILQSLVQQQVLSRVMIVQWGGRLALLAVVLCNAPGVALTDALLIMVTPELAGGVLLLLALARHLKQLAATETTSTPPVPSWPVWREVRSLMRHNYGYAWLIAAPQANAMIVLASVMLTAPQVAAYGFFAGMVERLRAYLPLQFMLNLAEPVLVAGYVRDRDFAALCRRAGLLYKINVVMLMLFLAWSCAVAPVLTRLLTGEKYVAWALFLPLLVAQIALGSLNTILQVIVNCVGHSAILTRSGSVALTLMVLCVTGVIWSGQPAVLLLATPLVFEITNGAMTIHRLRKEGCAYPWHGLFHLKVASASIVACLCARAVAMWWHPPLAQVLAAGSVAAAIFVVCIIVLGMIERDDVAALKALVRPRFQPEP
jgi:O-antigen/teichoic acid export membrane protein